jgi:AraC-like DNA-binding protein
VDTGAETWCWEGPAAADLAEDLACAWHAEAGGPPRTLIPDACMDLLWISNGTTWLCGPETSSWTFELPPGTSAVGVRFRPAAAAAILRLDARDVSNARVRIDELWGSAVGRRVQERLDEAATPGDRIALLIDVVRRHADEAVGVDPVAAEVAHRLAGPTAPPVHELARDLRVSERLLHRRSAAAFGYGPSVLARILRVQRFLRAARAARRPTGLAEMAVAAGFSDQPHLTREMRAIAGSTPGEIVRGRGVGVRSVQDAGVLGRAS